MRRLSPLLALLLLTGCAKHEAEPAKAAEAATTPTAIAVETTPAARGSLERVLTLSGDIKAAQQTPLAAKVGGQLASLLVKEGDRVSAGQVVAKLDTHDFELQVLQAKASLAAAEASRLSAVSNLATVRDNYARLASLHADGGVSEQQLIQTRGQRDAAEAQLRAADAQIAQARAALAIAESAVGNAVIKAPFAGVVTQKNAEVGQQMQPMSPVVTVASVRELEVAVPVGQAFLAGVRAGQPARFTVATYPERVFAGRVAEVAPTVETRTRTATVKLRIPNDTGALSPGMFARVTLPIAQRQDTVVVPDAAVVAQGEKEYVFVVEQGRAVKRAIRTGLRENRTIELLEGARVGEPVVTLGQGLLNDGDLVKVVNGGGAK